MDSAGRRLAAARAGTRLARIETPTPVKAPMAIIGQWGSAATRGKLTITIT